MTEFGSKIVGKDRGTLSTNSTLSESVRLHIQEGILSGQLVPGQRLKETQLAAELQISRSPIREALKVLEDDGLIVVEPWKGLSIAKLDRMQMLELFAYREILEVSAVELACHTITEQRLSVLEELVSDKYLRPDITLAELSWNNQEFHRNIYEATDNEFLIDSVGTLRTMLALLPPENFRLPGRTEVVFSEHRAVVNALKFRDLEASRSAIRIHIRNSADAHVDEIVANDLGL